MIKQSETYYLSTFGAQAFCVAGGVAGALLGWADGSGVSLIFWGFVAGVIVGGTCGYSYFDSKVDDKLKPLKTEIGDISPTIESKAEVEYQKKKRERRPLNNFIEHNGPLEKNKRPKCH